MIMRKIYILLLLVLVCSCSSLEKDYMNDLNNGLETFENVRIVNENLIEGLSIKKIGFLKEREGEKKLVILLNDTAKPEDVKKYTLAIHNYLDKTNYSDLLKGKEYVSTPFKPLLKEINGHKYIILDYKLPVKRLKQIQFFLYDRDKFVKVLSKRITVKNIGI